MEFNVEYGGNNADSGVIEAIRVPDADVVAIEEAYGNMPRIAAEFGWRDYDARMQLVSRFPLLAPPEATASIPSSSCGPAASSGSAACPFPRCATAHSQIERNDAKPKEVMEIERNLRLPALEPTLDAVSVGEPGGAGVDIQIDEWPTDHRATVSSFEVTPAGPPTFIAMEQRLVEIGDDARVSYHAPMEPRDSSSSPRGEAPGGGDVADAPVAGERRPTGHMPSPRPDGNRRGYEAVLTASSGEELARIPSWVQRPRVGPEIGTMQRTYEEGRPVHVAWHAATGNRRDSIGIYKRGADPEVAYHIMWNYTDAAVDGSATFDDDAHGPWPLKPGDYSVYLLEDDSYKLLAAGDFSVRG